MSIDYEKKSIKLDLRGDFLSNFRNRTFYEYDDDRFIVYNLSKFKEIEIHCDGNKNSENLSTYCYETKTEKYIVIQNEGIYWEDFEYICFACRKFKRFNIIYDHETEIWSPAESFTPFGLKRIETSDIIQIDRDYFEQEKEIHSDFNPILPKAF